MRRFLTVLLAMAVLAGAGAGGWWWWQRAEREKDAAAQAAIAAYATGWSERTLDAVRFDAAGVPADFTTATRGLGTGPVTVRATPAERVGDVATSVFTVAWTLPGETMWTYAVPVRAVVRDGGWVVTAPTDGSRWNPDIKPGDTMTLTRTVGTRGDILDLTGQPLMPMGVVFPVALDPVRATPATATGLEKLVGEPAGSLVAKLAAAQKAGSKAPIPVITYREADFALRRNALDLLIGVIYPRTSQPLAETRTFGQPLLGSFGPVTAEVVKKSNGRYAAGDRAGLSGLQGQYDSTLAGTPGVRVTSSTGKVLFEKAAVAGQDLTTTLDRRVQRAAEAALVGAGKVPAALVAVDVPSGAVVAIANSPSSGFDRAVTGRYAPGSTFKIASTYAYLTKKLVTGATPVSCPGTVTVDGRAFRNYAGESIGGSPTFAQDFAHSCNTAFIQVAGTLGGGDLTEAAKALGVGAGWAAGFGVGGAFDGSVPTNSGPTDQAAAAIGQGRVEVSPLALAVMTASVARGSFVPPVFAAADRPEEIEARPLDARAVAALKGFMGLVVTEGTATVLRGTPGGTVSGKTGTAEFGTDVPPKSRAWFTGYQGNLAFAVLVEEGRSGGSVAAPLAKAFLTRLTQP